ncbi:MAG: ABC transporter permease [Chloroflexi bacterium]|nr:ABC transporter permease [Chloroflexota bacterium]
MLIRILSENFRKRKRRVGIAILAVLIGASLAASLLTIATDTSDKVSRELRSYGANILVVPAASGLLVDFGGVAPTGGTASLPPVVGRQRINESDLAKLKTIFWRNNIVGFAPFLSVMASVPGSQEEVALTGTWFDKELVLPAGTRVRSDFSGQSASAESTTVRAGIKSIAPWWKVQGSWIADDDSKGALVGAALAERLKLQAGDSLSVSVDKNTVSLRVAGILSTGGLEENQAFVSLPVAQRLAGLERGADRVLVSALTLPKEKLAANIRNKKPEEMSPKEYELWYCSPVIEAIAAQVQEVLPNTEAKPIRQISEAEGSLVTKVELMILVVTVVALAASALGVMTTMTTTVLERRSEIGLMKAIGADNRQVAQVFLAEAAVIGLLGGLLGYFVGAQFASFVGQQVFGATIQPTMFVFPATLLLGLGLALLGSALPVRKAVKVKPILLLKGN